MARVEHGGNQGDELYSIDPDLCINCGSCRRFCPVDCIPYQGLRHLIDQDRCIGCTICYAVCPVDAVVVEVPRGSRVDLSPPTVQRVKEHALARGPFFQLHRRAGQPLSRDQGSSVPTPRNDPNMEPPARASVPPHRGD